ncbi:MAG: TraB/GumN family protein [Oscillospiraceae bacterium]|jgi:uncharacterized protein YbaP (TraB family)|nr:TraB/GumN family protein [Oscillospiraceae bacterium]
MKLAFNARQRTFSLFAALLLILSLFGGCAEQQQNVNPLLWKVTSPEGQVLHLFGSIHAAEEDLYPLPDYINGAFDSSGALAVEADIVAIESDYTAMAEMSVQMMYADGQTIAGEIGAELHEKAKAVMADLEEELALGVPLSMLDMFRPAMWVSALENVAAKRSGLQMEFGLDRHFLTEAKARNMEILEVESVAEQTAMLVGFSAPLQAMLLESALEVDANVNGLKALYLLWKMGNEDLLAASIEGDTEDMPDGLSAEYESAMMTQRNIKMADAAKRYMSEGKNVFFVVGLGHMLGEDGIVSLLKKDGYTVETLNG